MLNEQPAPIFWDSAYWYVVPCEEFKPNHYRPVAAPKNWSATYGSIGGAFYALVRSPELWLNAPVVDVDESEIIEAAKTGGFHPADLNTKPVMRVGGK